MIVVQSSMYRAVQADLRAAGGVEQLVALLESTQALDLVHRILLLMQVLTDNDIDRNLIVANGGVPLLVTYLDESYGADVCASLLVNV